MKIGILGAGTLGEFLASTFCNDKHDVVLIDSSLETLKRIKKTLDVMTVCGDGGLVETIKNARLENARLFIAVGSNDAINIHACQIARKLGAQNTICRLSTEKYFDSNEDFSPQVLGINYVVIPQKECVNKIIDVLDNPAVLERITFSVPEASIVAFNVPSNSPLVDMELKNFPEPELINTVRFAAVVRDGGLIAPRGDMVFQERDEIYIAGQRKHVDEMLAWSCPFDKKSKRILIGGCSRTGINLAFELSQSGYDVRLIEKNAPLAEEVLNNLNTEMMFINGDASEGDVLHESGVAKCDVFIATGSDDESNILSCILAKRMGAEKVITLTNKEEYVTLVRILKMIDCGFSRWLVAGNSILRHISSINHTHTNAILHRADAFVSEYLVKKSSTVCGKYIDKCNFPLSTVLSLVFRGPQVLTPSGDLQLCEGDIVAAITTPESEKKLGKLF